MPAPSGVILKQTAVMATAPDLDALPLPGEAQQALSGSRTERIDGHGFNLALSWWNAALTKYGLPGGPVTGERDGVVVSDGVAFVSRGYLFRLANSGRGEEAVLRLLWHALLWGSGESRRNNRLRMKSVAADVTGAAAALRASAVLAVVDPQRAYEALRPRGRTVIKGLGPAFFTKFLYFAGAGAVTHPSSILDARVADALQHRCGWTPPSIGGEWSASTYGSYCRLLGRWADEASEQLGRAVGVDELELWLFDAGEGPAARRRRRAEANAREQGEASPSGDGRHSGAAGAI